MKSTAQHSIAGANVTYLAAKYFLSIRRVPRSPEHRDRIAKIALAKGEHLPTTPDALRCSLRNVNRKKSS